LEYWLLRTINSVAFLDHQMIRPLSNLSLFLQSLHKLQQTIFKFKCKGIECFKILQGDLFSLLPLSSIHKAVF
jgi:hypothetical protein